MIYNYHTHTKRCGHATGTEEEYVKRAIENGIKYMGFSDHIPLKFTDGTESGYRVPTCERKIYCDGIKRLAEKYKDKIDIKAGYEMEYYPEYFEEMLQDAIKDGAEYLILGQHYIEPENTGIRHTCSETDSIEHLRKYVELVISAMEKKVYTYVAHPDVLNFVGDSEIYDAEMRKICIAAREHNIPLEINFLGMRYERNYPNEAFWKIAGEEKPPVTFGFDAHDVLSAYDGESLEKAKALVDKYDLNYIGKPTPVLIQELSK